MSQNVDGVFLEVCFGYGSTATEECCPRMGSLSFATFIHFSCLPPHLTHA